MNKDYLDPKDFQIGELTRKGQEAVRRITAEREAEANAAMDEWQADQFIAARMEAAAVFAEKLQDDIELIAEDPDSMAAELNELEEIGNLIGKSVTRDVFAYNESMIQNIRRGMKFNA